MKRFDFGVAKYVSIFLNAILTCQTENTPTCITTALEDIQRVCKLTLNLGRHFLPTKCFLLPTTLGRVRSRRKCEVGGRSDCKLMQNL
jgi:hypothetical protein